MHIDLDEIAIRLIGDRAATPKFKKALIEFLHEAYGTGKSSIEPDLACFVNAQANTYSFQGKSEENDIRGDIQLSPGRVGSKQGKKITITKKPDCRSVDLSKCRLLYDSLAFTDVLTNCRVTPEQALERQLTTLAQMSTRAKETWLVSYDRLIDEKYVNGTRKKQRWSVEEGLEAVNQTVDAAKYLDSQRKYLNNYVLVQSCQGVDALQYRDCVEKVLEYCQPQDVLGLGGWCILGRQASYLPVFYETIEMIVPLIASKGLKKIHIFGVTWYKTRSSCPVPPLQGLLWMCDRYGISVSTDSTSPIGNALWKDTKRSGAEHPYWRHNLAWVKAVLATLRESDSYRSPCWHWSNEPLFCA